MTGGHDTISRMLLPAERQVLQRGHVAHGLQYAVAAYVAATRTNPIHSECLQAASATKYAISLSKCE